MPCDRNRFLNSVNETKILICENALSKCFHTKYISASYSQATDKSHCHTTPSYALPSIVFPCIPLQSLPQSVYMNAGIYNHERSIVGSLVSVTGDWRGVQEDGEMGKPRVPSPHHPWNILPWPQSSILRSL